MSFDRRTFLIGAGSGLSLLVLSACTTPDPVPTPTATPSPSGLVNPVGLVRSKWAADPLARGSISFVFVGSTPDHRAALARPIDNRLFFAGEATSVANGGTVLGALESGERAAAELAVVSLPGDRVTIVGAGAAGAAAARKLSTLGFDVTVIDGRDRTGGRIHTATSDNWPVPVEFGAQLTRDSSVLDRLAAIAIGAVPVGVIETRDSNGAIVGGAASDEALYGVDPTDSSIVTGGYVGLVDDLLGDAQVYLSTTVTGIAHDQDSVSVRLATGESLTTDRVIVTVPLGVLKEGGVAFEPALPEAHATAIDALGVATVDTVWLRFDERFWTTDAAAWRLDGTDDDLTTWLNLYPVTGEPVLVGLVGGDAAERISRLDDAALRSAAIAALQPFATA